MSHNLTQHLLHALRLTPAFMLPLLVAMPSQYALANASGCSRFGDGLTCIYVIGDGLNVSTVQGAFRKVTSLCNWHYNVAFINTNGITYHIVRGTRRSGCYRSADDLIVRYSPPKVFWEGRVCAQLYKNGFYVDAACVNITP